MTRQADLLPHIIEIKEALARLDGIPARVAQNERDVAELRTTLKTIWRVVAVIPLLGAVLAFFGIPHFGSTPPAIHQ
jgi:5-bromo-4-chloroindolyl phosphate hydrolysis protein